MSVEIHDATVNPSDDGVGLRIQMDVAAPHYTVDGEVNDGHFEMTLSNSHLEAWNVDESSDLTSCTPATTAKRRTPSRKSRTASGHRRRTLLGRDGHDSGE